MTKKKPLTKEEQTQAAILNGLIQGYGLDKLMKQQERKVRRRWVKYFWFPLYSVGNPLITLYLFYTKHYVMAFFMTLYTIYGFGRMFYGDRFVLVILKPFTKVIMKKYFGK